MTKHETFLSVLPEECHNLKIEPRHRMALKPFFIGSTVWVVLITDMPEQADKAWCMTNSEFRAIEPKHETRVRWIRENMKPVLASAPNPPNPQQASLF